VTRRGLPKHADCASRHGGEDSKLSGHPPSAIQPFNISIFNIRSIAGYFLFVLSSVENELDTIFQHSVNNLKRCCQKSEFVFLKQDKKLDNIILIKFLFLNALK
jgi:hypothetical protein